MISGLKVTNAQFRISRVSTAALAAKRKTPIGTAFTLNLSERSTLRLAIVGKLPGRKAGKRCVVGRKHGPRCSTIVSLGPIVRSGRGPGHVSIPFSGRVGSKTLPPGSYLADVHGRRRRRQQLRAEDRPLRRRRSMMRPPGRRPNSATTECACGYSCQHRMAMSQQLSPMLGTRTEVRSRRGAVSAGHPLAVHAGLSALAEGGNAIDAAVAAAFAAFVAEPNNAGIGGYGHLSAFLAGERRFFTVDHGPRAPQAARADMFEVRGEDTLDGHDWPAVVGDRNSVGYLAPAVPGAVAGLWAAHQRGRATAVGEAARARDRARGARGSRSPGPCCIEIAARCEEIRDYPALAAIVLPMRPAAEGANRRRPQVSASTSASSRTRCG